MPALSWEPSICRKTYEAGIQKVRELIRKGDTYQVNYTYRLRAGFAGDPWALFAGMVQAQGAHYSAFIHAGDWVICCASPELFFRRQGADLLCRPMKGTSPRGLWSADDAAQAEALRTSVKNQAENVMIVDMVRNDLGRVARLGSVGVRSLFDVEKYPTLWQMTSTVKCETSASVPEIFGALFPAASITGAPKVRTMAIISELEDSPRRIYTGSIGFIAPGGFAQFNVAIRTVLIDRHAQAAEYGVGGGIVWDSVPETEFEECQTKSRILTTPRPQFALLETMRWTPKEGFYLLDLHLRRLARISRILFVEPRPQGCAK